MSMMVFMNTTKMFIMVRGEPEINTDQTVVYKLHPSFQTQYYLQYSHISHFGLFSSTPTVGFFSHFENILNCTLKILFSLRHTISIDTPTISDIVLHISSLCGQPFSDRFIIWLDPVTMVPCYSSLIGSRSHDEY